MMAMMARPAPMRILIAVFIASIAINAILGIWALLVGDFGDTEGKVLATSFLVSAAMLSALVNAPALRRGVLGPVPIIGAATGAAGFALLIALLWADADGDTGFKLVGSLLVVAAAATLAANLALIALAPRFRMVQPVTQLLIAVLAATILVAIWGDGDGDILGRVIGIESVLVAAATLLIPALSRFAGPDDGDDGGTGAIGRPDGPPPETAVRFCPSCGGPVDHRAPGETAACDRCGLRFDVTVDEERPVLSER